MKKMSETELSWLAGLLEGEGCFFLTRDTVRGRVEL